MKNINPYLEIYQQWEIIIQYSEDFENEKEKDDFFDYINFLKWNNIDFTLLDKNWNIVYKYLSENKKYIFDKNYKIDEVKDNIRNILLLENSIEFRNEKWRIIEFVSKEKLEEILKENIVDSNTSKKLKWVLKLLKEWISKVTLSPIRWLKAELEWLGAWTMFVDLEKAEFKKLKNKEIFYQIYKEKIISWEWKRKKDDKIEEIAKKYNVYEIDWTILGWYYLWDYEVEINWEKIEWQLLENLFASRIGWWIWPILWEKIKEKNNVTFAYSKREDYFTDLWFIKVEWKKSETWADLWMYKKS